MGKLSQPTPAGPALQSQDPAKYEQENVHDVYEEIASHFSSTRYKPWPLVSSFLETLPPGSIGADLGCGNGKYLHLRSVLAPVPSSNGSKEKTDNKDRAILILGLDRSFNLIDIAATNFPTHGAVKVNEAVASHRSRNEVCVGDALLSGYRSRSMDFAMSIATIHHFSTEKRRIEAVQELIRIVNPIDLPTKSPEDDTTTPPTGSGPGRFMIYVWALEQRGESRRNFEAVSSSASVAETTEIPREQDLLVPWVNSGSFPSQKASSRSEGVSGEATSSATEPQIQPPSTVFQRFYHVFREGELEDLVDKASHSLDDPDVDVVLQGSGWERGNWWGVWRVQRPAHRSAP
ncbi:hypothetical protein CF327_g4822 [Tilletia walkeri]|nr:hypothetical protein CF327_g4822 [Tilletia walkeri]